MEHVLYFFFLSNLFFCFFFYQITKCLSLIVNEPPSFFTLCSLPLSWFFIEWICSHTLSDYCFTPRNDTIFLLIQITTPWIISIHLAQRVACQYSYFSNTYTHSTFGVLASGQDLKKFLLVFFSILLCLLTHLVTVSCGLSDKKVICRLQ